MPDYEKPRDFFRGRAIPIYTDYVSDMLSIEEAMLLQQLHYWLKTNEQSDDHIWDGHVWAWNSIREWVEEVPVGGEKTIRRLFDSLIEKGLVLTCQHGGFDRRKSYTIVYNLAEKLPLGHSVHLDNLSKWTECPNPFGQNVHIDMDKRDCGGNPGPNRNRKESACTAPSSEGLQ